MTIAKTASEAKALGLTTYYTGRLCDEGHDAERWAITKRCVVCQPTDRSKEYVQEMWQAFSAAYCHENGGEKVGHGSGGMSLLRAA